MPTYAIGDVQGCFTPLKALLDRIQFDPARDRLWLVGDLVNRGRESLQVLRYVKQLGSAAVTVLGNHDLYLLAAWAGIVALRPTDTIQDVLAAPDRDELLDWLGRRPLLVREASHVLVHAGLLPRWSVADAEALAREAERCLHGPERTTFLRLVFETRGIQWSDGLTGTMRAVAAIKVFTRLRVCTEDGTMDTTFTGPPEQAPPGYHPWFHLSNRRHADATVVCGHWAALGLLIEPNVLVIDSGCVWGRALTAVRLEDRRVFQVSCPGHRSESKFACG
jgi:bis(5'-nucleosyl)-tetraphosphatase (symmetrical)